MTLNYSERGFGRISFKDSRAHKCSLQESSAADGAHIWLGMDEAQVIDYDGTPRVLNIKRLGGNVMALARMHLSQYQVSMLLPYLRNFVKNGTLRAETEFESDTQRFETFAKTKGISYFGRNDDGTYKESMARVLHETWEAAQQDFNDALEARAHRKDLNRDVKFAKDCDCGCNAPSFTEPWDALRFLMHRMNSAGVSDAVGESYAYDIMQILKAHDQVEAK